MKLATALRFAARELRAGVAGFRIFIACIAIGVAAIASVSTITRAITDGVAAEGGVILGGDLAFSQVHEPLPKPEADWVATLGRQGTVVTLRSMARSLSGENATLAELKAVDGAYPLLGTVKLEGPKPLAEALARQVDGHFGVVVDPVLLARLDLRIGDALNLGRATLTITDALDAEPDQVGTGVDFGPRIMLAADALKETDLIQPGSLVRYSTRVLLAGAADDARLQSIKDEAARRFPDAGWKIDTRTDARPGLGDAINRLAMFLTLVGLTALLVGGVGVTNAVKSALDARKDAIATLKAVGASGRFVVAIYLLQIICITLIGIGIGLALGAVAPFVAANVLGQALKLPVIVHLHGTDFIAAFLFGLLTAVSFAIASLGRAHDIAVSMLFRDRVAGEASLPRWPYLTASFLSLAALIALAIFSAFDRQIALFFVGASLAAFLLLWGAGRAIMKLAALVPPFGSPTLRLALRNIHRPGGLTVSVVLSLGLGLTLLVALAEIDGNLRHQLTDALPAQAPSFFFVDIKSTDRDAFAAAVKAHAPEIKLSEVPMLRGRLLRVNDVPSEKVDAAPNVRWVLQDERGITFAATAPDNTTLTAGSWWAPDNTGEPLVSLADDVAEGLKLKVGDRLTVSVLGRTITARIANLRKVTWNSLAINFVMVFSPDAFAGAPYMTLATATYPDGGDRLREIALLKVVTKEFPTVSAVRVKDVLETVNGLLVKMATAIRAASSVALISSILVLAGALAAGHEARIYDAVILKTLGASRSRILLAFALEYLLLGLATAVFGLIAGTAAAFAVVSSLMHFDPVFVPGAALLAALGALVLTIALGLIGTARALSAKPAAVLRSL